MPLEDIPLWVQSLLNGFTGSIIYILIQKIGWNDRVEAVRRIAAGLVVGYITHAMGHLDPITTIVAGYAGIDFIEAVFANHKRTNGNGKPNGR